MKPAPRSDLGVDLALGLLLGVGAACWAGLVAAQLGYFRLAALAAVGLITAAVATGLAIRSRRVGTDGERASGSGAAEQPLPATPWRGFDGPVVFVLLALLYAPGYDTTLYGSDATAYLGSAVHIARSGSLVIEDPLLARLQPRMQNLLFSNTQGPGLLAPRWRSPSGFAYRPFTSKVYSTYSQLPSVWLAIGFAAGGLPGALLTTPLLAAGGLTAFYIFVRRLTGVASALLAVGLLGVSVPQIMFARLSMGEIGAQFFLWSGLLAYARWAESGARVAAVAAGAGLGLAGLARPEFLVFVPLSIALLRFLARGEGAALRLPVSGVVTAAALVAHAWVLILYVVPSHYALGLTRLIVGTAGRLSSVVLDPLADVGGLATVVGLVVALLAALVLLARSRRGGAGIRGAAVAAVGLCIALAYFGPRPAMFPGTAATWFPRYYVTWPVMVVAVLGAPLLAGRWWREPSARLAVVIGAIAACCFLYDPQALPIPLWAGRRFLPVVLPLVCAAAAALVVRLGRVAGPLAAGGMFIVSMLPARPYLFGPTYLGGTSAAAAEVAALVPSDAVVLIDYSLSAAELDVALTLMHGRDAVQIGGGSEALERAGLLVPLTVLGEVVVLRDGFRPPLDVPGVRAEAVGERTFLLMLGRQINGVPASSKITVRAFRVEVDAAWFRERTARIRKKGER